MELRVLKYFLIVAREENITKAANLLHLTQPTLSRQLMQLEDELGVKLFKRSKHCIILTEDGIRLKYRAQEIIALTDKVKSEFSNQEELSGEISIGCAETQNMSFLSEKMKHFREIYPRVSFNIYSATADDVRDRIEQGLIDIGLFTEPVDISKYDFLRMKKKEEWGVLVHKDTFLFNKESVSINDIIDMPIIMPGRKSVQHELSSWFAEKFESINVVATYNLITNAANMVHHGLGIALCFKLDFVFDDVKFIPLSPSFETGAVIAWKKNQIFFALLYKFINSLRNA